jgi:hypothetical protein
MSLHDIETDQKAFPSHSDSSSLFDTDFDLQRLATVWLDDLNGDEVIPKEAPRRVRGVLCFQPSFDCGASQSPARFCVTMCERGFWRVRSHAPAKRAARSRLVTVWWLSL